MPSWRTQEVICIIKKKKKNRERRRGKHNWHKKEDRFNPNWPLDALYPNPKQIKTIASSLLATTQLFLGIGFYLSVYGKLQPLILSIAGIWISLFLGLDETGRKCRASIFFQILSTIWFARSEATFNNNLFSPIRLKRLFLHFLILDFYHAVPSAIIVTFLQTFLLNATQLYQIGKSCLWPLQCFLIISEFVSLFIFFIFGQFMSLCS